MDTSEIVSRLYDAYLAGDQEGMLALMADDVEVRFLGRPTLRGLEAVRDFLAFSGGLLEDLEFNIDHVVVDGDVGAGLWTETAVTADGQPWRNHGVDVVHVRDGRIVALHENNDVRPVRSHHPTYDGDPEDAT